MSVAKRVLLTAAAFLVVTLVMYLIARSLGIETGTLQSAVLAGVIAAVTGSAWRITAPKKQPPP
jgi:uncharacterized membrane protein YozB (DUF420 family)